MSLASDIENILISNKDGLSDYDIKLSIGYSKREIKDYLISKKDKYILNEKGMWQLKCYADQKNTVNIDNSILNKLQNKENALIFSNEDFLSLEDWEDVCQSCTNTRKYLYESKFGRLIVCDSEHERTMIAYLEENNLVKNLAGQKLSIRYNRSRNYYPDIVALTKDDHIAIIEVKAFNSMSNCKNITKYNALKDYCIKKGYEYMMIDPEKGFLSFEEIKNMSVDSFIVRKFMEVEKLLNKDKISITDDEIYDWYRESGKKSSWSSFKKQVRIQIIKLEWFNKSLYDFEFSNKPF